MRTTILIHPQGKFWAVNDDGSSTTLVFGARSSQTQDHEAGYANKKIGEKMKNGYIVLLDNAVRVERPVNLKEAAYSMLLLCQGGIIFGQKVQETNQLAVLLSCISLDKFDKMRQTMEMHFQPNPDQMDRISAFVHGEGGIKILSSGPIPTAINAVVPSGPWSW
jgi:hypothetical protein